MITISEFYGKYTRQVKCHSGGKLMSITVACESTVPEMDLGT